MLVEKLAKFQEAYNLDDAGFAGAIDELKTDLGLKKSQLQALLQWYEGEVDLGSNPTEAQVQKTVDAITRKGWNA